jgi:hypothetical protein
MSAANEIEYMFTLNDGSIQKFKVVIDRKFEATRRSKVHPHWVNLDFNQCQNCPLKSSESPLCPVAVDVEDIAVRFQKILSSDKVLVQVECAERKYSKNCDVQTGLRSLLGLVMATSACPILSQLRPLAYYHLPFANQEETLFRTVSAYLLRQYLLFREGKIEALDLKGLDQLYKDLLIVNRCFKTRVEAVSDRDANMNALVSLFSLSMSVAFSLEDGLKDLNRFSS